MRKEILGPQSKASAHPAHRWLDLESKARVRLTSEDPEAPIESALRQESGSGWRAGLPGLQTVWIDFDEPTELAEVYLRFEVPERRTQEFLLEVTSDQGKNYRQIVRQQFNFSPDGGSLEEETYALNRAPVTGLRLTIIPDISNPSAHASLRALWVR